MVKTDFYSTRWKEQFLFAMFFVQYFINITLICSTGTSQADGNLALSVVTIRIRDMSCSQRWDLSLYRWP